MEKISEGKLFIKICVSSFLFEFSIIFQEHSKKHKQMFCDTCEIMFETKKQFEQHKKKLHQVKCQHCSRSIRIGKTQKETSSNIKSHMISKHPFLIWSNVKFCQCWWQMLETNVALIIFRRWWPIESVYDRFENLSPIF